VRRLAPRQRFPPRRRSVAVATTLVAATVVLEIVCGTARPASAQALEPPRGRQGYYLAFGPHFALNKNWEDGRDWGVWTGYDVTIRAGQMVTRRFGLGLQIHFGGTDGQGQQAGLFGLSVEGQWELARHLAVRGGVGLDVVSIATVGASDESLRGTVGSGYFLGLSYDWFFTRRLTGGWALTPVAQARFVPGDNSGLIGTVGVEISYWTGLPRNQLDLPPSEAFKPK
jgi:hypothetical protein